ncbi:hypothetical protein [Legionella cincinnatiensis]|uniref:Uncharacterized protein n=1 Tax=Legionella cincinnatiensis TaxID=28085 RepID=A0A378IPI5_9GAMM|nr:hypothetical protein [Legionella cincinnatiensis]KTC92700.1 hypothetical protein Lcin_0610 [Legionella cincinnatiensis]STX33934.1 Uncharacterised protein [Legionella cincinnatiensis]
MIYLYIPFKRNEGNKKLIKHANQWYKTAYEGHAVSCTILSADDTFSIAQDLKKNKIYVLAYEADAKTGMLAPVPNSISCKTIDAKELVERLLASRLPEVGPVEIKLCVRQEEDNDCSLISSELIRSHLLNGNYKNPALSIQVQCSPEPFPGETNKLGYRTLTGSIPLFFKEDEIANAESSELEIDAHEREAENSVKNCNPMRT